MADDGPDEDDDISVGRCSMELGADFGDEQRWKKHANTYLRDRLGVYAVNKAKVCCQATVKDDQKYGKTGLDSTEERLS